MRVIPCAKELDHEKERTKDTVFIPRLYHPSIIRQQNNRPDILLAHDSSPCIAKRNGIFNRLRGRNYREEGGSHTNEKNGLALAATVG